MSRSIVKGDDNKYNLTMPEPMEKKLSFLSYWYFRYLLVTELYIVEEWERVFIHVFLLIVFGLLGIFNYSILLPLTTRLFISQ